MKKTTIFLGCTIFIVVLLFLSVQIFRNKIITDFNKASIAVHPDVSLPPTPLIKQSGSQTASLFVPYWGIGEVGDMEKYQQLIYFGVTPTNTGIDTDDPGYKNISAFRDLASEYEKETLLTLRMLDRKENFAIIENAQSRQKVMRETIAIAKEQDFDGIVLDLEVAAIPFDSVVENISVFVSEFARETKSEGLQFQVAIYGDTFYRLRPFDVKKIGSEADKVLIMAYDMHKSRGNPGPNFPLAGSEQYGYDMTKMIGDFSAQVPPEKLAVVFGMFGYDWEVDGKGNSVGSGAPLSYLAIKQKFIDTCEFAKCEWKRDEKSGEITVTYTDGEKNNHIIWFEDPQSTRIKQDFLKTRGISAYSFWASSYF